MIVMTEAQQRSFYFPAWNRCTRANDWRMERGRLVGKRAASHGGPETSALYERVWIAAEELARRQARSVTAEDLRHACHVVALGRDKSSKELRNAEVDRVVGLFRVLQDPDDLDALLDWLHPENGERKRLVAAIKAAAPHAYIDRICRSRSDWNYEPPFWEDLELSALRQLRITLRRRTLFQTSAPGQESTGVVEAPF